MTWFQQMVATLRQSNALPKARRRRRLPRPRGVDGQVRAYAAALTGMIGDMADRIDNRVTSRLEGLRPARLDGPFDDVISAEMDRIRDEYQKERLRDEVANVGLQVGTRVNLSTREQIVSVLGEVPVPNLRFETLRDRFASENASLIKSLRAEHVGKVEKAISRAFAANTPQDELREEIRKITGVSEGRARVIADDQVRKLQGRMTQQAHAELGVDEYVWRSQRDNRTRPAHAERDGRTYRWDDPPADGHPSEPIGCRCYAEPVVI